MADDNNFKNIIKCIKKFLLKLFSVRFYRSKNANIIVIWLLRKRKQFTFSEQVNFPAEAKEVAVEYTVKECKTGRTAIFAGFRSDGKISDGQIYYLNSLSAVCDNIIFVCDNPIFEAELEKIRSIVCYFESKKHGMYDFGSYKIGYDYAKSSGILSDTHELIFANDSCYGAIYPFENYFNSSETENCDFWGITSNLFPQLHIQSYFYLMKKRVFESEIFKNFIENITVQNSVNDVIKN